MKNSGTKSKQVAGFIKKFPAPARKILEKIRMIIRKAAPLAEETISYGIPGYKLNGRPVVYFGGFREHVSLFPTSSGVRKFRKELAKYETTKGTIKFPLDKPIPYGLIKKIVKSRVRETI